MLERTFNLVAVRQLSVARGAVPILVKGRKEEEGSSYRKIETICKVTH